jgi:hypothetical protein
MVLTCKQTIISQGPNDLKRRSTLGSLISAFMDQVNCTREWTLPGNTIRAQDFLAELQDDIQKVVQEVAVIGFEFTDVHKRAVTVMEQWWKEKRASSRQEMESVSASASGSGSGKAREDVADGATKSTEHWSLAAVKRAVTAHETTQEKEQVAPGVDEKPGEHFSRSLFDMNRARPKQHR